MSSLKNLISLILCALVLNPVCSCNKQNTANSEPVKKPAIDSAPVISLATLAGNLITGSTKARLLILYKDETAVVAISANFRCISPTKGEFCRQEKHV